MVMQTSFGDAVYEVSDDDDVCDIYDFQNS